MKILWAEEAWQDYLYWQENDRAVLAKVNTLIKDVQRTPFKGLGKPEPLKGILSGWWSRRITGEHRLAYRVTGTGDEQGMHGAQCRYHY